MSMFVFLMRIKKISYYGVSINLSFAEIEEFVSLCCAWTYGIGFRPSQRTFHLPSFGNPGFSVVQPSQPAHIMATAVSSPPLPGR